MCVRATAAMLRRLKLGAVVFSILSCASPDSTVSSNSADSDVLSEPGPSFFDSPDEIKHTKERRIAREIELSLLDIAGITAARVHLTLADNSVFHKSQTPRSRAAVLVVRDTGTQPDEAVLRDFVLGAVPNLDPADLHLVVTNSKTKKDQIVAVGYLRVAAGSVDALKMTLAVLLCGTILTGIALIAAGITIRRLKHPKSSID